MRTIELVACLIMIMASSVVLMVLFPHSFPFEKETFWTIFAIGISTSLLAGLCCFIASRTILLHEKLSDRISQLEKAISDTNISTSHQEN